MAEGAPSRSCRPCRQANSRKLRKRRAVGRYLSARSRDGQYRWFLSRALPIRNAAGQVIRWFGTNTDITEQFEAETALRELNENLEQRVREATRERLQIWTVSQDLLAVADLEGKYLSVNPAWLAT